MLSDFSVHFSPETAGLLSHMAMQKHKTVPELIESLTLLALEDEQEDRVMSAIADSADMKAKKISHDDLWQKFQD